MFSPRRMIVRALVSMALAAAAVGAAQATDLASGTVQLSTTDPTQLGRLSRNGVPTDWSGSVFPGIVNPTVAYHYETFTFDVSALEAGYTYGSYLQITFDSIYSTTFLSAYLDSYSPTNLATNYLGDPGTSGNYFGTDPLTFQVVVGAGHNLVLVMNETTAGGGAAEPGNFLIEAFSDTEFSDLVAAPVPEPATWSLMLGGLALAAVGRKRRAARRCTQIDASN